MAADNSNNREKVVLFKMRGGNNDAMRPEGIY